MKNTLKSYSLKRAQEQIAAVNLKSEILIKGTTLQLEQLMEGTIEYGNGQEKPNDVLLCKNLSNNKTVKVSVREFQKMELEDGAHFLSSPGDELISFPERIIIISSTDRKDRKGNVIYPIMAYEKVAEFLAEGGKLTWDQLVEAGFKKDHGYAPVQTYTIKVQ